jgi:hypothetical protein
LTFKIKSFIFYKVSRINFAGKTLTLIIGYFLMAVGLAGVVISGRLLIKKWKDWKEVKDFFK